MSYDLNFWRYEEESRPRPIEDHVEIYRMLCEGAEVTELAVLPINAIKEALINKAPAEWAWNGSAWEREHGGPIEVMLRPNWVRFDLYGNWSGDDANWLIDMMASFRCPLFDPQVPERFAL